MPKPGAVGSLSSPESLRWPMMAVTRSPGLAAALLIIYDRIINVMNQYNEDQWLAPRDDDASPQPFTTATGSSVAN